MYFRRLRDLRELNNLKQKDIISMLQIKPNTYSYYENGLRDIPFDIINKIAIYYETSIDYLVGLTDNKKSYKRNNKDINFENIRKLRKENNLNQQEIADKINLTKGSYNHYETGKRIIPYESLIKLADYYNTSIDYLLGVTDERKKETQKEAVKQ